MSEKYRKKPIIIEAFQMTKKRRLNDADWPYWLQLAWQKDHNDVGMVGCEDFPDSNGKDKLIIRTLEGVKTVDWDNYIIQGVDGEFQIDTIKPDIFEANYERI